MRSQLTWFLLLSFAAWTADVDSKDPTPERGSVGEEIFGFLCDRVAAQALHEDLTGASFRAVCHRSPAGAGQDQYAERVDTSLLPALGEDATDDAGRKVPVAEQEATRA